MRWALLVVVIVAGSALLPYVIGALPGAEGTTPDTIKPKAKPVGPPGKVVVDAPLTYKFGTMPLHGTGTHVWTVKNEGTGDLLLRVGESTCSCTVANMGKGETAALKPGESQPVKLTWEGKKEGSFRQEARIYVENDPDTEELAFSLEGKVEPPVVLVPPEPLLEFGSLPEGEPRMQRMALYSPDRPDLKITGTKASKPDRVQVKVTPLNDEEKKELRLETGYKVEVEVRPGKELGAFRDEVVIKTDHPMKPEVTLTVMGRVDGPVTVSPERLSRPWITSARGATVLGRILVRGQERTTFRVAKAPKHLKVAIEPDDASLASAAVKGRSYRLMVEVPPGTPTGPINGEIVLKTDHPQAEQVKVPVSFLVAD